MVKFFSGGPDLEPGNWAQWCAGMLAALGLAIAVIQNAITLSEIRNDRELRKLELDRQLFAERQLQEGQQAAAIAVEIRFTHQFVTVQVGKGEDGNREFTQVHPAKRQFGPEISNYGPGTAFEVRVDWGNTCQLISDGKREEVTTERAHAFVTIPSNIPSGGTAAIASLPWCIDDYKRGNSALGTGNIEYKDASGAHRSQSFRYQITWSDETEITYWFTYPELVDLSPDAI
ncbi:hypothetical protein [Botrimarina colliarenosi]|uniref:hypothetical protein n=1 Tax=Botrimarina colliarenosi TaxID=2528001 RepID=UPI0011B6BC10|nr:hypothetical protein [Botrimarina colliarenosi]